MEEECLVLPLWLPHPVPLSPPLLSPPLLPLLQMHSPLSPSSPKFATGSVTLRECPSA